MATEQKHLAQAVWHIAQAEERVRGQRALVDRLAGRGEDAKVAGNLLETMRVSLALMQQHRAMIESAIAAGHE